MSFGGPGFTRFGLGAGSVWDANFAEATAWWACDGAIIGCTGDMGWYVNGLDKGNRRGMV